MFRICLISIFIATAAAAQEPPKSFSGAKKYLADLHEHIGYQTTLYCGCTYKRTTRSGGAIQPESCGLKARKNEKRAGRVEWEHVVPASWFGQTRACWKLKDEAYPACAGMTGRKCCEHVNANFALAHNDPNNLFPSTGEVNGDRSNHPYGDVAGEDRHYGKCDFELGSKAEGKVAEPPDSSKGAIARSMLYMAETYGVDLRIPIATLWKWNNEFPAETWEIERAEKIAQETGLSNWWVLGRPEH